MSATSALQVSTSYSNQLNTGTGGTLTDSYSDAVTISFASGVLANQIDLPWSHVNTNLTTTETFTLSALTGPGAATTDMARVRKIEIRNLSTTDGNIITITPGSTHPWTAAFAAAVTIPAGGVFILVAPNTAGFVVTASTADQITVTATGTVSYKLCIEGCSA